jgi:hypothetical protein
VNNRTRQVLRGFIEMTASERDELIAEMNKFLQGNQLLRESIEKSIRSDTTVNFGPAPGTCPCCGR